MSRSVSAWYPGVRVMVGQALPTGADVASAADVYTYGAASQAYTQGQAMAAWAELAKQQNAPGMKSVAASYGCPAAFLFSPTGETCVNQSAVHVQPYNRSFDAWYHASALVCWLRLHESSVLKNAPPPSAPNALADACLRGLRALGMTTGSYGWTRVQAELRAVASWVSFNGWGGHSDGWAGTTALKLEKAIRPAHDSDAAAAKKSGQLGLSWWDAQTGGAGPGFFGLLFLSAAAFTVVKPTVALGLFRQAGSAASSAASKVVSKVRT